MRIYFPHFPVRRILFGVLIAVALVMGTSPVVFAAPGVPEILHYQGRLLDSNGNLLGGSGTDYCFRFSFFDDGTVGGPDTQLWPASTPSDMTVQVVNGVFAAGIGDVSIGGDTLDFDFTDDTVYLNIEVATEVGGSCGGGDESYENLEPRQRILSSGYAINSGSVFGTNQSAIGTTTVEDNAVLTLEATSTSAIPLVIRRIAGQVSNLFEILSEAAASLFTIAPNGNVGIGTSTPYAKLSVEGDVVAASYAATTTATSTFVGGIDTNLLNVTATNASSTFANGIDLTDGCFSIGGNCLDLSGSVATFLDLTDTPSSYTANALVFANSSANGLTQNPGLVYAGGLLGVGSTSPSYRLSVSGDGYFAGDVILSNLVATATLGVGTSSPAATLGVGGLLYVGGTGTSTIEDNLHVLNTLQVGNGSLFLTNDAITGSGDIAVNTGGNFSVNSNRIFIDGTTGNVGIGTSSPYESFSVAGTLVAGTLIATTTSPSQFLGGIDADTVIVSSTTATSTFANGVRLTGGCYEQSDGTCLQISNPVVGQFRNSSGGGEIHTLTATSVPFDVEARKDTGITHPVSNDPSRIQLDDAGWYRISYTVTGNSGETTAVRGNILCGLRENGGSSYVDPSTSYSYNRGQNQQLSSNSASFLYQSTADSTYIQIYCEDGMAGTGQNPTIPLLADESWITIEKLGGTLGDTGGGGANVAVQENDTTVVSSASSLDFLGSDFAITNAGGGEANIAIDYTNSSIARKNQNETITGLWSVSNLLSLGQASSTQQSVFDRLFIGGTATTTILGDNSTSTFAGGIESSALNITSGSASSTFANGIVLDGGCVLVNNNCLTSNSTYTSLSDTPGTLTANAIQFTNSGGSALTQNTNFVFDAANNRLGVGEANPEGILDLYSTVYADVFIESATNTSNASDLTFRKSRLGGGALGGDEVGALQFDVFDGLSFNRAGAIEVITEGTVLVGQTPSSIRFSTDSLGGDFAERMRVTPNGDVGIGTTTPAARFTVEGDSFLSGNVIATGTLTSNILNITSSAATSTFANGINITNGCFSINDVCLGASAVENMNDLSDVDTSGVVFGNILTFNGADWVDTATSALAIALSDTVGTLAADRGGTGLGSITNNELLVGGPGNTITQIATSSLGLSTTNVAEGSNLYYTATRVENIITGSSTIVNLDCGTGEVAKADGVGGWNCQPDLTGAGAGGGSGLWATTTDSLLQYPTDPTRVVVLGGSATTSTGNIFEVIGASLFDNVLTGGTLTVQGKATFNNASSTAFTSSNGLFAGASSLTSIYGDGATSTFANGIDVSSGCVSVGGTCIVSANNVLLNDIQDVALSAPSYGNVLIYNGADWVNVATATLNISLSDTKGTLSVNRGGTGATAFSSGGFLFGNGTAALNASSSPTVGWITATSTTATSTFANGITLNGGCVTVGGNCLTSNETYLGLSDTPSSFTANAIQYANTAGTALEQAATFVYDSVNTRLGIGEANPEGIIHTSSNTNGNIIFHSGTSTSNATDVEFRKSRGSGSITSGDELGALIFNGFDALSYDTGASIEVITEGTTQVGKTPSSIRFSTDSLSGNFAERLRITPDGNIGIGTTSPYEMLSVAGGIVANYLTATSTATSTFTGGIKTNLLNIVSVNASSTFANGIAVNTGCVSVAGTCLTDNETYISLTDTPSSFTANAIQFANSGGSALTQSSNLSFVNNTTLVTDHLSVSSTTATSTFAGNVDVSGNASTSNLYVSNRIDGAGLTDCSGTTAKLGWDASSGQFVCGNDQGTDNAIDAYDSTGGVALVNGVQNTLNLDATTTQGSAFDLSNDEITILEDGLYLFIAHLTVTNPDLTGAARAAMILNAQASTSASGFVNLPNGICRDYVRENGNDLGASCMVSWIATSTVGDRYRLQHSKGDTTTMNTLIGGSGLSVVKLSDETTGADLAEVYYSQDISLSSGEIVAVDNTSPVGAVRSTEAYQKDIFGIVTTKPGLVIGTDEEDVTDRNGVAIALTGRVPMKVTFDGGAIEPGDVITSSDIPGVGMKATKPGNVIGIALEGYTEEDALLDEEANFERKIMVFVNPHWYGGDPDRFADWFDLENLVIDQDTETAEDLTGVRKVVFEVLRSFGLVLEKGVATLSELFADKIVVKNADIREAVLGKARVGDLSVENSFEMTDQNTGKVFCMILEDGKLEPVEGKCNNASAEEEDKAPVITILGNNPSRVAIDATYNDLGALVEDDKDTNLGITTLVDGNEVSSVALDTSVSGDHIIMYRAEDQDGNVGEAERHVIVGSSFGTSSDDVISESERGIIEDTGTSTTESEITDTTHDPSEVNETITEDTAEEVVKEEEEVEAEVITVIPEIENAATTTEETGTESSSEGVAADNTDEVTETVSQADEGNGA